MNIHKEEMNIRGFTKLGINLTPEDVSWFKDHVMSEKDKEIQQYGKDYLIKHKDYEIMRNMLRFGNKYFELIEKGWVNNFVNNVLNPAAVVQDCFGMVTRPVEKSDMTSYNFHRDQPWVKETRTSVFIFIPLVDFTATNGATEVVPGTHLFKRIPSPEFLERHKETLTACAGEAMGMDAALWHRAGVNKSQSPRPMIFLKYQLAFLKQPIDLCRANADVLGSASELVKRRMGWDARQMGDHSDYRLADRPWKSGQYCTDNCGIFDYTNIHEYL